MASRGRQALALDHVHAQLGGARLVPQREVHRAAHLHRARLGLPGQAQLAAAQLRAGVEVRAGVQGSGPGGGRVAGGSDQGAREGSGRGYAWGYGGKASPTRLLHPQALALTPHRGGVEAGHGGAAAEHAVE